jgi:hypothetical protein
MKWCPLKMVARRSYILPQFVIQPPTVPTGLTATVVSTSQINLSWNASIDPGGPGVKDYGVYRAGVGLLAYVTGTSYSDTGLTASTSYTYWVTARDLNLHESNASATVSATTQTGTGTTLVHGQQATFLGPGLGTKASNYQVTYTNPVLVWDNCSHGQALSARWDQWFPTGNINSADDMVYRSNGFRGITTPSLRSTGFAAGAENGVGVSVNVTNTSLVKHFTRPTPPGGSAPFMLYQRYYEQADPLYDMSLGSPNQGNYKLFDYGTGYYDTPSGPTDYTKDSMTATSFNNIKITASISGQVMTVSAITYGNPRTGATVYGPGVATGTQITGQLTGPVGGIGTYSVNISQSVASQTLNAYDKNINRATIGDAALGYSNQGIANGNQCIQWHTVNNDPNPTTWTPTYITAPVIGSWVEIDWWLYAAPDSTGVHWVKFNNQDAIIAQTGKQHSGYSPTDTLQIDRTLDPWTPTTRTLSAGGYREPYPGPNQYIALSDLYMDVGEGWIYLTNSATWGQETIREIQIPVANQWADSGVTVTINGGRLPSGSTVHAHFRMAPWRTSGHKYFGAYTLQG